MPVKKRDYNQEMLISESSYSGENHLFEDVVLFGMFHFLL